MQVGYVWPRDQEEIEDNERAFLGDPDIVSESLSYFNLSTMNTLGLLREICPGR
jgi:hypothetical protein